MYNGKVCDENDFVFFQHTEFVKCYKFNSGETYSGQVQALRKTSRYGKIYGFRLELFVELPDKCKNPLTTVTGFCQF